MTSASKIGLGGELYLPEQTSRADLAHWPL
jgi:hypothetical protein